MGLDYLANAGHPGNWWGIVTDNGRPYGNPVVQGKGSPYPGYYISETSLQDSRRPAKDTARYVNSETVPFIVLPIRPSLGAKLGDLAMVFRPSTGDSSFAIYADVGPSNQVGEGSMALADNLQVNSDPKRGGVSGGIVTLLFKGVNIGWPRPNRELLIEANNAFKTWGGFAKLRRALPEIDWSLC